MASGSSSMVERSTHHPNVKGLSPATVAGTRGQCYKTFYRSNLPPFHGNTVILCYKAILPWKLQLNGSKLPRYLNPRKSKVKITTVIYHRIVL